MRPEIAPARWVYIPEKNGPGQRVCVVCWSGARENPGVTEPGGPAARFSPRTVWTQNLQTPLRRFLRTETGSAAVLLAATLAALAWANIDPSGYAAAWHTELMIRSGTRGLADSWQGWVNSGLMAFFFLVAGLEARREFDLGELRERRRLALPLVVALGGIVVPISIYLAINAGGSSASGWGAAMSTDTAFALGALALAGPGVPDRVRTYLLTFALARRSAGPR
jgi:Na+/H+ antiporter NhaA